jgi:hypothetical protein
MLQVHLGHELKHLMLKSTVPDLQQQEPNYMTGCTAAPHQEHIQKVANAGTPRVHGMTATAMPATAHKILLDHSNPMSQLHKGTPLCHDQKNLM